MPIDIIELTDAAVYRNPGKTSVQLLAPDAVPDARVTITRVTMAPGAVSTVDSHDYAEQIWLVEQGTATMLLADDMSVSVSAGQLVRTPARTAHGLNNTGVENFVYLSITTPPENMAKFYVEHEGAGEDHRHELPDAE